MHIRHDGDRPQSADVRSPQPSAFRTSACVFQQRALTVEHIVGLQKVRDRWRTARKVCHQAGLGPRLGLARHLPLAACVYFTLVGGVPPVNVLGDVGTMLKHTTLGVVVEQNRSG